MRRQRSACPARWRRRGCERAKLRGNDGAGRLRALGVVRLVGQCGFVVLHEGFLGFLEWPGVARELLERVG